MKYLFCGVDGVLHAAGEQSLARVPRLERVLRTRPNLRLVVFDPLWAGASLLQVRDAFSPDLRARIMVQGEVKFPLA